MPRKSKGDRPRKLTRPLFGFGGDGTEPQPPPPCAQTTCPGWQWVHSPLCERRITRLAELRRTVEQRRVHLQALYSNYQRHHSFLTQEEDLHGMWDAAVNMSEVSNRKDELEWVLGEIAKL